MYRFVYIFELLLASFIVTHARHTVFISNTGAKTYLPSSPEPDVCMTPTCVIAAADILTSMDETLDPCDDFFSFACGGWIKRQEVSDDQPMINMFEQTQNSLDLKLKEILESKYQSSDPPFVRMIKDFYNTCVDLDTIEKQGSDHLKKILRHLGGWPVVEGSQWDESQFDWIETLISFRKLGYNYKILLDLFVHTDRENSSIKMLQLEDPYFLSGLTGANLSLGLDDDEIAAFHRKMVKAAKLLGAEESTAEKEMLDALSFEIALINISKSNNDQEISLASSLAIRLFGGRGRRVNRKNTFAKLQNELPQVPWLKIVNGLQLTNEVNENETFIDGKHEFLVKFADLITSTDKRAIANYMLWIAVLQSAEYLSKEWKDLIEEDDSSKEKLPRWKQCLKQLEDNMEIGISSYYVRNYFNGENKDEAIIMMKYIHKEFLKILEHNDWMDEKTRKKAEDKANAIKSYIGYPQELLNDTFMMKTYENLTQTKDSYLDNVLAIRKWGTDKYFLTLKDMSDEEPSMKYSSLIEVNAYYDPEENSIGIPAGILHEAFFDKDRPNYLNYGITGYTIGHEITHGFDNDGRKYDKDGKKGNWWDKESDKHFRKKAKCMVDQYNNYTTYIGMKVNGEKTLGENIADNGGMKEAYLAYHTWIKDHGTEPLLPGVNYNQNQLFWLGAAYSECAKYKPEKLKEMLLTDEHSPGKFRVIGSMSNLPEFSKDFKCSPDAPMNRKYKCQVW